MIPITHFMHPNGQQVQKKIKGYITITHFMRPNGQQVQKKITNAPEEIEAMANKCIDAGARFTEEVLRNGMVSFACEYKTSDSDEVTDIAIELSPNDPSIVNAFEKMICDSHKIIMNDLNVRLNTKNEG